MFILLGPDHLTRTSGPDWQLSFHDPLGNSHTSMPWSIWFVCVFFIIYFEDQDTLPTKKTTMHVTCVYMRFNLPSFINIPQILGKYKRVWESSTIFPNPGKLVNLGWVGEYIMCGIKWGHVPYRKKKGLQAHHNTWHVLTIYSWDTSLGLVFGCF